MGALLLGKQDTLRKSFNRIGRMVLIVLVFSVIYYIYYVNNGTFNIETASILDFIIRIWKSPATNALWYMYLYIGLLIILRFLQKMVSACSRRDLQLLLLLLLGIMGVSPLIHVFLPFAPISIYFTTVLFSPYIGMVVAGYYIERYMTIDLRKFFLSIGIFVALIVFQVIASYYLTLSTPGQYPLDDRTMITITGSAICFYIVVKYVFSKKPLPDAIGRIINTIGGLTFGIYLLSDLIMHLSKSMYEALCSHMHIMIAMILWEIFIFTVGAIITAGLKKIPFVKNWL